MVYAGPTGRGRCIGIEWDPHYVAIGLHTMSVDRGANENALAAVVLLPTASARMSWQTSIIVATLVELAGWRILQRLLQRLRQGAGNHASDPHRALTTLEAAGNLCLFLGTLHLAQTLASTVCGVVDGRLKLRRRPWTSHVCPPCYRKHRFTHEGRSRQ